MALSFASAPGNLMNRLGKAGLPVSRTGTYQANLLTDLTNTVNGLVAQFNGESDIQALIGSSYQGTLNGAGSNTGAQMAAIAEAVVNRMVFRDNPRQGQTLQQQATLDSLVEIIRQMKLAGATVLAATIGVTPGTTFLNPIASVTPGVGVLVASTRRPSDGLVLQNAYAETLKLTITDDQYVGNAQDGSESWVVQGAGREDNPWAFNWPLGSGASQSGSAIDGNADNNEGNKLTNSGFNSFTGNFPNKWERVTGTAGTHFNQETTITYDSTGSSLRITGDGSTLTTMRQKFNDVVGTLGQLQPLTQHSFNVFARRDGTAAAAGQWTWDLVDVNGVIINDADGVANTLTIDLTTLSTAFSAFNFFVRTPHVMPSVYYLRGRHPAGNALSNGRSVYFDKGSLGNTVQAYSSGPYLALHSGNVPFKVGDYNTVAVTNGRGAGGTLNTFQTLLARLFHDLVYSNELIFPYSATPTIPDGLIG